MNPDYGFIENEFTGPDWEDKKYWTDDDPARVAVTTKFTDDKPEYYGGLAGTSAWWWLRSPGHGSNYASGVRDGGAADAGYYNVPLTSSCLRPAFRMNLASSSSLWSYAGTVSSVGSGNEIGLVTGVTVSPKEKTIKAGVTATLSAEVKEYLNAPDKTVTWTSSDEKIVTVDSTSGSVTGVKAGTATITATTTEGGYTDTCKVIVVGPDMIADPSVADGVSTWDCIWFGNYWQEDTNGDGYCFEKDTT
ncbi:MAG: Ig domain-containing protein, partial [Lachnospiraceae bacterium]|nr:Ig domain-containing protein [Lachnospiraceae bacterium]